MGRAAYNRPDKHQESYGYVPIFKGCEGRSSMPLETWKAVADWSTIVLIALTVVSGSAALVLGRRINDNQQARLGTSAEVVGITEQISEVLTRAKWTVHFGTAAAGAVRGILIGTDSPPSSSTGEAVLALSNALKSVGLSCSVYPITQMPLPSAIMNTNMNMKEPIRVFVGNKP